MSSTLNPAKHKRTVQYRRDLDHRPDDNSVGELAARGKERQAFKYDGRLNAPAAHRDVNSMSAGVP